ncbi:hypothetical protein CVD28_00690 [Bacillus sp. M6-12]|uniref:hypothetical protein n=1 Tax=Bacillus sp. M6-12 TaxID=2054166 RepID=UPI000C78D8FC|nr:hypothetical protein [Bacillus sp. M6-12]PLS18950.1 hypothetical protein CVD28_00690 [Bacillus sp. M6-12]
MNQMTMTEFKKEIMKKGKCEEYQLAPYFTLESWSAKMIILSNKVTEPTEVTYRKKVMAVVFPMQKTVKASLTPYFETLQQHIRVMCPVMTVFDLKGNQVVQLHEEEKENIA